MIKKIKASFSEKILLIFLVGLFLFTVASFILLKNKCLFVEDIDPYKIEFSDPKNIVIMDIECGKIIIELFPNISPNTVSRFKIFIEKGLYDGSAFYKVLEDTLVQAGDLQFGNIKNLNYYKIGSGKSGLGLLKSELNEKLEFIEGTVAFARGDMLNTEDSEFFIILKDIPLYQGEFTPVGKVIHGIDALKKIKVGYKSNYVLRPDIINSFKLFVSN